MVYRQVGGSTVLTKYSRLFVKGIKMRRVKKIERYSKRMPADLLHVNADAYINKGKYCIAREITWVSLISRYLGDSAFLSDFLGQGIHACVCAHAPEQISEGRLLMRRKIESAFSNWNTSIAAISKCILHRKCMPSTVDKVITSLLPLTGYWVSDALSSLPTFPYPIDFSGHSICFIDAPVLRPMNS